MDRVEFTAGRAQTAADTTVDIDVGGAALQTAVRFCAYLFFCQGKTQILVCMSRITRLVARYLTLRVIVGLQSDIISVEFLELTQITSDR